MSVKSDFTVHAFLMQTGADEKKTIHEPMILLELVLKMNMYIFLRSKTIVSHFKKFKLERISFQHIF